MTFGKLRWAGFEIFHSKVTQLRLRDNGQWGSLNHSVRTGRGARKRVLGCYKPTAEMHTTGAEPRTVRVGRAQDCESGLVGWTKGCSGSRDHREDEE